MKTEYPLVHELEGCGLSVMDKCYGYLPPDGSVATNLIEVKRNTMFNRI